MLHCFFMQIIGKMLQCILDESRYERWWKFSLSCLDNCFKYANNISHKHRLTQWEYHCISDLSGYRWGWAANNRTHQMYCCSYFKDDISRRALTALIVNGDIWCQNPSKLHMWLLLKGKLKSTQSVQNYFILISNGNDSFVSLQTCPYI